MQIARLFEIVYLLMDRKSVTARELAAHFEVSVRTVLRDIDTLADAGIPVYTTQGKGGGISILDRFVLNKAVISEDEQNQILFALQSLAATQQFDMENVLGRLRSLFAKTEANWIAVDFSRWGNSTADQVKFELLKHAILQKHMITFSYSSSYGETKDRKVYPLQMVFKGVAWYLRAFCVSKNDYRTFKINRMREVQLLDECFAGKAFSMPELEPDLSVPSGLTDLKLRFSPQIAYRVYDEFDGEAVQPQEDGSCIVTTKVPADAWLCGYILSFGTGVEVLEPQDIREEMMRQAEAIQKKYKT